MLTQKLSSGRGQLCLQFPPDPPRLEVLQTDQVSERFGKALDLRLVLISQCVEYKSHRIWHKGRNRWEIIRID